jgi:hypothetical protein
MVDMFSLWGLTGVTATEIYRFISDKKANSSDVFKKFSKGIEKTSRINLIDQMSVVKF